MDNFALNENDNCGHSGDVWTFVVWMCDAWTGDELITCVDISFIN